MKKSDGIAAQEARPEPGGAGKCEACGGSGAAVGYASDGRLVDLPRMCPGCNGTGKKGGGDE